MASHPPPAADAPDPIRYTADPAYLAERAHRAVRCPTCGAWPARPCRTTGGRLTLAHAARRRRADTPTPDRSAPA